MHSLTIQTKLTLFLRVHLNGRHIPLWMLIRNLDGHFPISWMKYYWITNFIQASDFVIFVLVKSSALGQIITYFFIMLHSHLSKRNTRSARNDPAIALTKQSGKFLCVLEKFDTCNTVCGLSQARLICFDVHSSNLSYNRVQEVKNCKE